MPFSKVFLVLSQFLSKLSHSRSLSNQITCSPAGKQFRACASAAASTSTPSTCTWRTRSPRSPCSPPRPRGSATNSSESFVSNTGAGFNAAQYGKEMRGLWAKFITFRQWQDFSRGYETEILPLMESNKATWEKWGGIMQPSPCLIGALLIFAPTHNFHDIFWQFQHVSKSNIRFICATWIPRIVQWTLKKLSVTEAFYRVTGSGWLILPKWVAYST